MKPFWEIAGRLGNNMYQFAYIVLCAKRLGEDGHFPHSPHWFKEMEGEILQMYREETEYNIDNRVSIHVRRTDYLDANRVQYTLPMNYYEKAMAYFPNDRFLVFSDDMEWCKQNFTGDRFDFSEGNNEVDDMNLMACCKHNIISNSTFSTWAALLNPNPDKIVIAPLKWEKINWKPTLPSNWILI